MNKHFKLHNGSLFFKAVVIGAISGLIVSALRFLLLKINIFTAKVINVLHINWYYPVILFLVLCFLSLVSGFLTKKYPMIKGSGIPQIKAVLLRKLKFDWFKELIAKFIGTVISLGSGLSLGMAGVSVEIGAFTSYAINKYFKSSKENENYLLVAGSVSGLASAFNAPISSIIYSFEEFKEKLSHELVVSVILSCISSVVVTEAIIGQSTIFSFKISDVMPVQDYILIVPLGIICGIISALFNFSIDFFQNMFEKINYEIIRQIPVFLLAWFLFMFYPYLLGSGIGLMNAIKSNEFTIVLLFVLVFGKLIFTSICYGSGASGGIFFPILILGALIGSFYYNVISHFFNFNVTYSELFIVLGMTAFFSGVTRAPITACILLFEMSGSIVHFIPLIIVSLISYGVAKLCKAKPIYDQLLERLLKNKQ